MSTRAERLAELARIRARWRGLSFTPVAPTTWRGYVAETWTGFVENVRLARRGEGLW